MPRFPYFQIAASFPLFYCKGYSMPQAEGMQSMILANFQNQNNNTCLCYSVLFQWSLGSFFAGLLYI